MKKISPFQIWKGTKFRQDLNLDSKPIKNKTLVTQYKLLEVCLWFVVILTC